MNLRGHVPKTCGWPLPYTWIKEEGPFSPLLLIPSRRPPGATCVPRPPDRAALPSPRQWTCTPSEFRRSHHAAVPVRANPVEGEQHRHGTIPYPGRAHRNHGRELGQQEYVASHRWPASPTLQRASVCHFSGCLLGTRKPEGLMPLDPPLLGHLHPRRCFSRVCAAGCGILSPRSFQAEQFPTSAYGTPDEASGSGWGTYEPTAAVVRVNQYRLSDYYRFLVLAENAPHGIRNFSHSGIGLNRLHDVRHKVVT